MGATISFLVSLALLIRAVVFWVRERSLARRLVPVQAKVLDPGLVGKPDAAENAVYRSEIQNIGSSARDGSDPHTHIPRPPTVSYSATWEYTVDGKTHRYTHTQSSQIFRPGQIKYARAQVFYDKANPAVSRPYPGAGSQAWAWFIGAGAAAVVGLVMLHFEFADQRARPSHRAANSSAGSAPNR